VPPTLHLTLGAVLVVVGFLLVTVAVLAGRGALRRNRFAGIRTAATMASAEAFTVGNRVAAPLVGAAGVVGLAGGAGLLAGPAGLLGWVLLVVAGLGVVVLGGVGGALGDRAARTVAVDEPAPCAGSCAGCDLVAGCRPQPATGGVTA
jgi:hypothetical protein